MEWVTEWHISSKGLKGGRERERERERERAKGIDVHFSRYFRKEKEFFA